MTARFGHTKLPPEQVDALRRAVRLEWVTIAVMTVIIVMVFLVAGQSQAMKAAWIEDGLSFLPPIAFLVATKFIRRLPNVRRPYGYHRAVGVAHLVAATALLAMGSYIIIESAMGLISREHPPIGLVVLFGSAIWAGWLMVAVMTVAAIPPIILGRIKLKIAAQLHDKVLYADAQMNKADWMTSLATVVGVLGIGIGLWWADAAAAIVIALSIVSDGWKNLRDSVRDLMDARATQYDGVDPDPLNEHVTAALRKIDWVANADCRIRDQGHVLHIEAFVVPKSPEEPSLAQLKHARERCVEISWRIQDLVLVPVEELPEEFLPQVTSAEKNTPTCEE